MNTNTGIDEAVKQKIIAIVPDDALFIYLDRALEEPTSMARIVCNHIT